MSSIALTIDQIRANPFICQDPTAWIPEGWSGTLLDLYNLPNLEENNKVLMGVLFLPSDELRAFAEYCAVTSQDEMALKVWNRNPVQVAAWLSSKYAAASGVLGYAAQIVYLKAVENTRL